MTIWELQFQGTHAAWLLGGLVGLITAGLLAAGAWHLLSHRWRLGFLTVAAAGSPLLLGGAFLVDAVRCDRAGDPAGRRGNILGTIVCFTGCLVATGFIAACNWRTPAVWLALVGTQVLTTVGVFYLPLIDRVGPRAMGSLMVLRGAAILALLLVLFKPTLAAMHPAEVYRPTLTILVDCSGSMAAKDNTLTSRLQRTLTTLATQVPRLESQYHIEWLGIAQTPLPTDNLDALAQYAPPHDADSGTDLPAGLRIAAERDSAATILISDGIDTSGKPLDRLAERFTTPLHTVGVGSAIEPERKPNAALANITSPLMAASGDVITIEGDVQLTEMDPASAQIRLVDEDTGQVLTTQTFWARTEQDTQPLAFEWTVTDAPTADPDTPPVPLRKLTVEIVPMEGETTDTDNRWPIHVLVTHPSLRVLYVEGVVRPEFKWLRRLLHQQTDLQCITMVRVDDRRFWVQGSVGGKTLVGLPNRSDDLAMFDVILLGDMPPSLWTRSQLAALDQFVRDGGGLMALGGQYSLHANAYAGTGLETLLPITFGDSSRQSTTPFTPALTSAGVRHPIFRGLDAFFASPDVTPRVTLPALTGTVIPAGLKPGATVLATGPERTPVLAVQSYGAGRSAAFMADTTWRWRLQGVQHDGQRLYDTFWLQCVRWLAGQDAPTGEPAAAIAMAIRPPYVNAGEPVAIFAQVVDDRDQPPAGRQVQCDVLDPDGQPHSSFTLSGDRLGAYRGEFAPDAPGEWTLTVNLQSATDETPSASDTMTLNVHQPAPEMAQLARNAPLLRRLAMATGGEYVDLAGLPDLVDRLVQPPADAPIKAGVSTVPLYHFPILFGAFVVAITLEWSLRRRWQLA